jgi:hypothetical protein
LQGDLQNFFETAASQETWPVHYEVVTFWRSTMTNELRATPEAMSDFSLASIPQALSDWAELGVATVVEVKSSLQPGCCYSERLIKLQEARRLIGVRIEKEQRMGRPTSDLEQELEAKRMETRSFLAYLRSHARVRP